LYAGLNRVTWFPVRAHAGASPPISCQKIKGFDAKTQGKPNQNQREEIGDDKISCYTIVSKIRRRIVGRRTGIT
jgi:hypothetical protein